MDTKPVQECVLSLLVNNILLSIFFCAVQRKQKKYRFKMTDEYIHYHLFLEEILRKSHLWFVFYLQHPRCFPACVFKCTQSHFQAFAWASLFYICSDFHSLLFQHTRHIRPSFPRARTPVPDTHKHKHMPTDTCANTRNVIKPSMSGRGSCRRSHV